MSLKAIAKACRISSTSACRTLKESIEGISSCPKRTGRPQKLTVQGNLRKLRNKNPSFSPKDLMQESGVSSEDVAERTVNSLLQRQGFHYLQTRKKGLLTKDDMPRRVTFCDVMKTIYDGVVWMRQVAFYLDRVSFAFKTNPLKVARAPKARIWRKLGMHSKGK